MRTAFAEQVVAARPRVTAVAARLVGDDAEDVVQEAVLRAFLSLSQLRDPTQFDTGSWHVEGDRLCREWQKTMPLRACWTAVVGGSHIDFFDRDGLMVIEARIEGD